MKKWSMIAIAALSLSVINAGNPEKVETLSAKIILENTNGYFVLSDGSHWKAIGFSKRWRSLNEWWNNVQLVPENYECVPNDWYLGAQIEAYSKYDNLSVRESDAVNQEALKQCTHLLVNSRTGQVLFAISLHPAECATQLFKEAHEEGYNKGIYEGRLNGYKSATETYNVGHESGYKTGYAEGYKDGLKEGQPGA